MIINYLKIFTMKTIKYSIAFRKDGEIFRVKKGSKLPDTLFYILDGDRPGYKRAMYFTPWGELRKEFNSLPIL